jgi:hypothetical protein
VYIRGITQERTLTMSNLIPKLLTPSQAAEAIGVQPQTLAVWRASKRYPLPYVKSGRLVRYRESDLLEFIRQRTVHPGNTFPAGRE